MLLKKILVILAVLFFLMGGFVFIARFLVGGGEDTWIQSVCRK